jgi:hypothetical protein
MKTIELKWIEDDNNVVAKQANTGLQDLIDTGVFKTLTSECKDDTLYITGEKDELDKAVMKLQKAYAEYGQIMIKEAKKEGGLRIESYDDNVQEIFDYTVKEFDKLKENKHSADYITKLGDLQIKFMKLKEAASRKDKATIQNYLDEISTLTENAEIKKIKPIKKIDEGKLIDADALNVMMELIDLGYDSDVSSKIIKKYTNFINQELKDGAKPYWIAKLIEDDLVNHKFSDKDEKESYDEALRKQLSNPANWGIVEDELDEDYNFYRNRFRQMAEKRKRASEEKKRKVNNEKMTRFEYNDKFERVARMYAEETGKDMEDVYDELMDNDELPEYVDSDMSVYDIVYKVLSESTMNESFLSPAELKKKLQRVAMKWASEEGIKYEVAYNDLRKRKSVKDMLDFYTVDEIIDDLKKKKKEVDDELEEEI